MAHWRRSRPAIDQDMRVTLAVLFGMPVVVAIVALVSVAVLSLRNS